MRGTATNALQGASSAGAGPASCPQPIPVSKPMLRLDSHIDLPWPERDSHGLPATTPFETPQPCQFSPALAREGGLGAAVLAAYVPQGPLDTQGHGAAWARLQAQMGAIHALANSTGVNGSRARGAGQATARLCHSTNDVRAAHQVGQVAILPALENGYALGEDMGRIATVKRKWGLTYVTLTHNGHNLLGDSCVSAGLGAPAHGGLSELGREAVRALNQAGVLVDVSHASPQAMMEALRHSTAPVIASHSAMKALHPHPRNLDDKQLLALREQGGVVQVAAVRFFLARGQAGLGHLVAHIRHAVRLMGVGHVGISSDFDGGGGIEGWQGADQTMAVDQALVAAGFDESERTALWGGNFLRALHQAQAIASPLPAAAP
ncbi:membrane dipeptidase [Formicincola oecophyllae]|uniref:Membrane dipeptidase n=2 Tax=Formicincola oecophyllae TaxID=2558361 RepID=A0A4Y6UDA1_9PROT|nr:membrane dipeptidase [Formicincola oecophyllae]